MNSLNRSLTQPLEPVPNSLAIFILIVALIGFADAAYLTVEHYQNVVPPCSVSGGCEEVLTSRFATIYGVPISLVGAAYYFLILVGAFSFLESRNTVFLKWALLLAIVGFIASLWFVYLQAFVIRSYCAYCLGSAMTSTILGAAAIAVFSRNRPPARLPQ
jgi:uncharacterized membrane protein